MLAFVEARREPMKKQQLIKLALTPCRGMVREGGKKLKCNDIYRLVTIDENDKILSIKCHIHGHVSRGKARELANPLA